MYSFNFVSGGASQSEFVEGQKRGECKIGGDKYCTMLIYIGLLLNCYKFEMGHMGDMSSCTGMMFACESCMMYDT